MPEEVEPGSARLNLDEQARINTLLRTDMAVTLPQNIADDELWDSLSACCRALVYMNKMSLALRPLIGRMLVLAQTKPSFYRDRGYTSYDDFLKRCITERFGLSRTDAYDAKKITLAFPAIGAREYQSVGVGNLLTLSRVTNSTQPGHKKWLETARGMRRSDLRTLLEEKNLIEAGEDTPAAIIIATNVSIAREWKEFINTPEIQAYCGTGSPGEILRKLMQECGVEWMQTRPEESNGRDGQV